MPPCSRYDAHLNARPSHRGHPRTNPGHPAGLGRCRRVSAKHGRRSTVTAGPKALSNKDMGGLKITNLAEGTSSTDAASKSQLDAAHAYAANAPITRTRGWRGRSATAAVGGQRYGEARGSAVRGLDLGDVGAAVAGLRLVALRCRRVGGDPQLESLASSVDLLSPVPGALGISRSDALSPPSAGRPRTARWSG